MGAKYPYRFRETQSLGYWCARAAIVAVAVALVRPVLLYLGYLRQPTHWLGQMGWGYLVSIVLFALSGILAGWVTAHFRVRGWFQLLPLLGVAIGASYTYVLGNNGAWPSPTSLRGVLTFVAQLFYPMIFAQVLSIVGARRGGEAR